MKFPQSGKVEVRSSATAASGIQMGQRPVWMRTGHRRGIHPEWQPQTHWLYLGVRNLQRIVNFNLPVPHGAFQLRVAQQQLHCPQVFGSPVNQSGLDSAHRMYAIGSHAAWATGLESGGMETLVCSNTSTARMGFNCRNHYKTRSCRSTKQMLNTL